MKKHLLIVAALVASSAFAADVEVSRKGLGLGTPGTKLQNAGVENAKPVNSSPDVLHTPQYLAGFPTAATIWPRIVEVPCKEVKGALECEGFHWTPDMGRGEYLFITPKVVAPIEPKIIERTVTVPGPVVEKKIFVEVPPKKKGE
jgi:hypothetical protein